MTQLPPGTDSPDEGTIRVSLHGPSLEEEQAGLKLSLKAFLGDSNNFEGVIKPDQRRTRKLTIDRSGSFYTIHFLKVEDYGGAGFASWEEETRVYQVRDDGFIISASGQKAHYNPNRREAITVSKEDAYSELRRFFSEFKSQAKDPKAAQHIRDEVRLRIDPDTGALTGM